MADVTRFPGLGEVIAENIGNLEEASIKFDKLVDDMNVQYLRDELIKYQESLCELKDKMILELLVDDEVSIDAKVYMSPNDSVKAVVVSLQNREDAIDRMLEADWLRP